MTTVYTRHSVAANGINLNYYRTAYEGQKPPIVMVHGLTDNGMCWVRVADALADQYEIILPDPRGHGFSDKPETAAFSGGLARLAEHGYGVEERAADVAELISVLGIQPPVLFGHSLGGQVANAIAALYPERVRALVLEDPAWFGQDTPENQAKHAAEWCAGLRRDQSHSRAELIAQCHQQNPAWPADELGPWADAKLQMSERALYEILTSMNPGWQGFLRAVRCPVLLVTGDKDIIITPAMYQEAAALNPRVREAHIPNAAHSIHRDNFAVYMEKVRAFLESL